MVGQMCGKTSGYSLILFTRLTVMRTLVTGGAGFIGSHLADALLARGDEVTLVDNFSSGRRENIESAVTNGAEVIEGDIVDKVFVEETLQAVRPQTLFHLAAQG